jgi:hypothetical protein
VYLQSASERIYSPAIYLLHAMMLLCSIRFLVHGAGALRIALPLLLILAQSMVIIPEQRFIFVVHVFLAVFTYLYLVSFLRRRPQRAS